MDNTINHGDGARDWGKPAEQDPFAVIDEMREAFSDVSADEIERETSRILAEVRAKLRVERERAAGVGG